MFKSNENKWLWEIRGCGIVNKRQSKKKENQNTLDSQENYRETMLLWIKNKNNL